MTILNYILQAIAHKKDGQIVWPECYNPKAGRVEIESIQANGLIFGICPKFGPVALGPPKVLDSWEDHPIERISIKGTKIIALDFQHLVKAVQENPKDNPAVRAFMGERAEIHGLNIRIWVNEIDNFILNQDFESKPNGNFFWSCHWTASAFRAEGYAIDIPREFYITPEELETLNK